MTKQSFAPTITEQVEIEAKMIVPSSKTIEILTSVHDIKILMDSEEWNVKDIYLDTSDSLLVNEDKLFRIRLYTNTSGAKTELSWKGPRHDKEIDTREDVSMLFSDNLETEFVRFYARLGFKPYLIINKRRRESKIGDFEYELDQDLRLFDLRTNVEKPLGNFISVCISIPIQHAANDLKMSREKVMAKITDLSNIASLESRTFVDLFHEK